MIEENSKREEERPCTHLSSKFHGLHKNEIVMLKLVLLKCLNKTHGLAHLPTKFQRLPQKSLGLELSKIGLSINGMS